MKIYVANLKRDLHRKASIEAQLNCLSVCYEIVEGVDGQSMTESEYLSHYDVEAKKGSYKKKLSKNQVACVLTHQKMYKKFLNSDESSAVFLEDDAELLPGFVLALDALKDFKKDYIILGYGARTKFEVDFVSWIEPLMFRKKIGLYYVGISPRRKSFGIVGICLSRRGAEMLLRNSPVYTVADDHIFFSKWMSIWHLRPVVLCERQDFISTLTGDRRRKSLSLRQKITRLFGGLKNRFKIIFFFLFVLISRNRPK